MTSNNSNNNKSKNTSINDNDSDEDQPPQIPYRRDRTPSIVVQSLGLSFHKDSNITESIELPGDEEDLSQQSNSSEGNTDPKSSTSGIDEPQNASCGPCDSLGGSAKGSLSSLQNTSPGGAGTGAGGLLSSPVRGVGVGIGNQQQVNKPQRPLIPGNNNRRLSLNIGSTAPRRQSLTVDGIGSASSFINPNSAAYKDMPGNATGSLRNKVALKPGHSLMGWIRLASTAKDLSGTNGKIIEVSPEELAKHDKENDCWVALKGNVYNVTTYLQYHPGGVEELMRGAGADATELFNEVHRWVNYESILAKCLVGPYKLESPLTPIGRGTFVNMTNNSSSPTQANKNASSASSSSSTNRHRDPTIAQKPPRRQSIALTVPSPNKYQSLLLNNNSYTNLNQIQQPPTYVIMQDKSCIKVKIQDINTLPLIRSRHLICDLNDLMELHLSIILSTDWLYRVHLRLDQKVDEKVLAQLSSDDGTITIQLNKKNPSIWNKIGTSMDLNDSLCEMTLADKFFRPCQLSSKKQLTHDTYLFEFKLENTLMYVPIGWHILMREHIPNKKKTSSPSSKKEGEKEQQQDTTQQAKNKQDDQLNYDRYDDYRVNKNYTPVLSNLLDNDGLTDETGFMNKLYFIIKIYPNGVLTSKLNQLKIGDSVDISDYQSVDFDIENHVMNPKHWFLFAAGTGITPFCRIISYLLNQSDENVKSVTLIFFNKTEKDIIWRDQFDQLALKHESRFKVIHVLSNVSDQRQEQDSKISKSDVGHKLWTGRRGKISKDLMAELVDFHQPDELQFLACGPRAFTQLTKTFANELNLQEKLYVFHG